MYVQCSRLFTKVRQGFTILVCTFDSKDFAIGFQLFGKQIRALKLKKNCRNKSFVN